MITYLDTHRTQRTFLMVLGVLLLASLNASAQIEPPAHSGAECAGCHGGGVAPQRNAAQVSRECLSCHRMDRLRAGTASVHGRQNNRCLECHSFHAPTQVTVASNPSNRVPVGSLDSAHCQGCHGPSGNLGHLSPAHRTAAELYHTQAQQLQNTSPSEACLNCHSNLTASAWQSKTDGAALAFNEHASHPYGIRVIPGSGNSSNWIAYDIDPRLPLFDGRMECQTCHLLTAGTEDLMIPFETKYDLCKGCHRQYGDQTSGQVVAGLGR